MARMIWEYGTPINVRGETISGSTPLHLAVLHGRVILASTFLDKYGADPMLMNRDHETLLSMAVYENNFYLVRVMLNKCGSSGAQLANHPNFLRETPLHQAASKGHPRIIRVLLDAGALTTQVDFLGRNVLHISAGLANKRGFEILVNHIKKSSPQALRELMNQREFGGGEYCQPFA
jgi:ankyrin repeat protein